MKHSSAHAPALNYLFFETRHSPKFVTIGQGIYTNKLYIIRTTQIREEFFGKMKPLLVIPVLAILISAGAVGLYFYTLTPSGNLVSSGTTGSSTGSAVPSGRGTAGTQDSSGKPQGGSASYLGYI